MLSTQSRVVALREHAAADLGSETAILNLRAGVYYSTNPVGSRIWSLVQEPCSVEQIRDRLMDEYAVDSATCEREVIAFLEQLEGAGLVEVVGGRDV